MLLWMHMNALENSTLQRMLQRAFLFMLLSFLYFCLRKR